MELTIELVEATTYDQHHVTLKLNDQGYTKLACSPEIVRSTDPNVVVFLILGISRGVSFTVSCTMSDRN